MNAKKEFLSEVGNKTVKCSVIRGKERYNKFTDSFNSESLILKVNHSKEDYKDFLSNLDYNYDNGYGGQELHGLIWYEDGTWSERGEYDGSEWWEYKSCPEIVEECK